MKRKFLIPLLSLSMATLFVLGCGHRPTKTEDYVQTQVEQEDENALKTNIYYMSDDGSQILSKEVSYEEFDENFVYEALKENKTLPDNIKVNSVALSTEGGNKVITVDFNKEFVDYLNTLSKSDEFGVVTSIVNTYLEYFGTERFNFTINGKQLHTKNNTYDSYLIKFEGQDNPEFGKFTTENANLMTSEYKKSFELLQAVNSENENVSLSPIMLKLQLFNIYDGASDTNKKQIEKYLEDINTESEHVSDFASTHGDDFNNAIIYHEGRTSSVVFANAYLHSIDKYNAQLHGIDFTKTNAAKDANNFINNLSFDEQSNVFENIDKNSNIFEVSTLNVSKSLSSSVPLHEEGIFYNADDSETTINYFTAVEEIPYFETEDIRGFVKDLNDPDYKLIAILPNKTNVDYSEIDFENILNYYNLEDKQVKFSIPDANIMSSTTLTNALKSNNIDEIFTFGTADFDNMFTEDRQSFVSDIKQFNKLSITADVVEDANVDLNTYEKEVILNQPFTYIIFNEKLNEVVLIGRVNHL